ncbi:hypothetical protein [Streptomyces sp. 1222.5]|uniref:hypothetical protein n=1 Tax=Streptomyces sp. 1222.5 TaxID=1881026 RepID=UPI003D706135
MLPAVCWITDRQLKVLSATYGPRVSYFQQSQLSALNLANRGSQPSPKIDHYPDVVAHRRVLAGEVAIWRMGRGDTLLACAQPLRDDDNSIRGVLGFAIDLSELQEQSEQREMNENLLEALVGMVPAQVSILDENQDPFISFTSPDSPPAGKRNFPGQRVSSQTVFIGSGKSVTLNVEWLSDAPEQSEDPEPREQSASGEESEHLRLLLESSPHAQALINNDGSVLATSSHWHDVFGDISSSENVTYVTELISPPYRERFSALLAGVSSSSPRKTERLLMQHRENGAPLLADVVLTCSADSATGLRLFTVVRVADPATRLEHGSLKVTATDAKILEMLAQGLGNSEIAQEANLSRQGLDYRIKLLKRTLRVSGRGALVARAYNWGLFDGSSWPPRVDQSNISDE